MLPWCLLTEMLTPSLSFNHQYICFIADFIGQSVFFKSCFYYHLSTSSTPPTLASLLKLPQFSAPSLTSTHPHAGLCCLATPHHLCRQTMWRSPRETPPNELIVPQITHWCPSLLPLLWDKLGKLSFLVIYIFLNKPFLRRLMVLIGRCC